jgi:hypothetical protein
MILPTGADQSRFYAYQDVLTLRFYFHNPITNETVWTLPDSSSVFYADSQEPFLPSHPRPTMKSLVSSSTTSRPHFLPRRRVLSSPSWGIDSPPSDGHGRRRGAFLTLLLAADQPNLGLRIPDYFPVSIETDQKPIDLLQFCRTHCRVPKRAAHRGDTFSVDDCLSADASSAGIPVLNSVDQRQIKAAQELFSYVVRYGTDPAQKPLSVYYEAIQRDLSLVDEAFVQVIRQARNNPTSEGMYRMWELLLVLSTCFVSTTALQPFVRQHLASAALGQVQLIHSIAQLCYLRFCARCHMQTHLRNIGPEFVNQIPNHVHECSFITGASLYELMWHQRLSAPKCPVPLILHRMCDIMISRGALEMEKIFQATMNNTKLENLMNYINCGYDMFKTLDAPAIGSVFRRWLSELPQAIIVPEIYLAIIEHRDDQDRFFQIIEELPKIHRNCLAYIVGFLKVVVAAEPKTKVGIAAVAMLFGSSCIKINSLDAAKVKEAGGLARDIMKYLIGNWDVAGIYPLDPTVLPRSMQT